jgi:hypothetical protein
MTAAGSAGARGQPVRVAPADFHGQRQQLTTQQQAAPLSAPRTATELAQDPSVVSALGAPTLAEPPNAFAPTQRPAEPLTAGAVLGPGASQPLIGIEERQELILQRMVQLNPHPEVLRLLVGLTGG